jgi:hypothetical protein
VVVAVEVVIENHLGVVLKVSLVVVVEETQLGIAITTLCVQVIVGFLLTPRKVMMVASVHHLAVIMPEVAAALVNLAAVEVTRMRVMVGKVFFLQ